MRSMDLEAGVDQGLLSPNAPPSSPAQICFEISDVNSSEYTDEAQLKGCYITRNGQNFAGVHLIIDLKNAKRLDDVDYIEQALIEAVDAAGATLLHIHLHHFSPNGGVSGVAVLAESHISIHTWPENSFAALDIFMCGQCNPRDAIPVLQRAFEPETIDVQEILRG